jgi:hypothetical protein
MKIKNLILKLETLDQNKEILIKMLDSITRVDCEQEWKIDGTMK